MKQLNVNANAPGILRNIGLTFTTIALMATMARAQNTNDSARTFQFIQGSTKPDAERIITPEGKVRIVTNGGRDTTDVRPGMRYFFEKQEFYFKGAEEGSKPAGPDEITKDKKLYDGVQEMMKTNGWDKLPEKQRREKETHCYNYLSTHQTDGENPNR